MRVHDAAAHPYFYLLLCCAIAVLNRSALGCTTFAIGRLGTGDRSVISAHSNDGEGKTDPRLVKIPARDYSDGELRPVYYSPEQYPRYVGYARNASAYYPENCEAGASDCKVMQPIGFIPQVRHTFAYFEETYGVMNEKQVSISESTCSGVYAALSIAEGGKALLSVDQLSQIAMERATTAREAVQLMGSLAEEYGFYGADGSFEGGSESLFVGDPTEVWAFHILADSSGTSAIWGAARVPDDSVAVVANMFSIRVMNMSDSTNFLGRRDMWELAQREGLYMAGQPKDFTATFSDGEYAHKYYSGRRMWGVFRLLAPSTHLPAEYDNLKTDAPYPFSVPVDRTVTPADAMAVLRDWYAGTNYSTGEGSGVAGGAFSTPDRYGNSFEDYSVEGNWERTIAMYRSSDTYIVQSRSGLPDAVGGVIWFGSGAAHTTVYVPVLAGMSASPTCLSKGWQGVYDPSSAFWANRRVLNAAQLKFQYMIKDIGVAQHRLETASFDLVARISSSYVDNSSLSSSSKGDRSITIDTRSFEEIESALNENAHAAVQAYHQLFDYLLFTYADGFINFWDSDGAFHSVTAGYPVWWLRAGNYMDGPPPAANQPHDYAATLRKRIADDKELRGQFADSRESDVERAITHQQLGVRDAKETVLDSSSSRRGDLQSKDVQAAADDMSDCIATACGTALLSTSCVQQCNDQFQARLKQLLDRQ